MINYREVEVAERIAMKLYEQFGINISANGREIVYYIPWADKHKEQAKLTRFVVKNRFRGFRLPVREIANRCEVWTES